MIEKIFTNYLVSYQSLSRTVNEAMWNQWRWMFAPCKLGIEMMNDFLVGSTSLDAALAKPLKEERGTPAEGVARLENESSPETLEQRAMNRLSRGLAPPREIYDVRNRGKINWSKVPEWAKPLDPELFEGSHEG